MTIVAVAGDCTTTTAVALAAVWPADDDPIVLECDPSGGSLAAWLDTPPNPSLATIVAHTSTDPTDGAASLQQITTMVRRSTSGVRFIAAPTRSVPARLAIDEASRVVIPVLANASPLVIADVGRVRASEPVPVAMSESVAIVVVHRLDASSPAAAAVRLERVIESIERLANSPVPLCLAIIGSRPFEPDEVIGFIDASVPGALDAWVEIADDRLSAAVIAGRTGVSEKRLRRLPLLRSADELAATVRRVLPLGTRRLEAR